MKSSSLVEAKLVSGRCCFKTKLCVHPLDLRDRRLRVSHLYSSHQCNLVTTATQTCQRGNDQKANYAHCCTETYLATSKTHQCLVLCRCCSCSKVRRLEDLQAKTAHRVVRQGKNVAMQAKDLYLDEEFLNMILPYVRCLVAPPEFAEGLLNAAGLTCFINEGGK